MHSSTSKKHETLTQCWYNVVSRLRRRPNVVPTLGERFMFAGKQQARLFKSKRTIIMHIIYNSIGAEPLLNYTACHEKPKASICLLHKQADTAFWLCKAIYRAHFTRRYHCWLNVGPPSATLANIEPTMRERLLFFQEIYRQIKGSSLGK